MSLMQALQGCLNQNTVHSSEETLKKLSYQSDFLAELLRLIPNQGHNLLVMVLTTLKNYMLDRYNHAEWPISPDQKAVLKNHLLEMFYLIQHDDSAVKLYKEIMFILATTEYPWPGADDMLQKELNGQIVAAVYFIRQVAKAYEYLTGETEIATREHLINLYFPHFESLTEKVLSNYNQQTAKLLEQILKTFYSSFHAQIPRYLRNFQAFDRWMLYFKTIMSAPMDLNNSNQYWVSKIFVKLSSFYCSDSPDGKVFKGWGSNFRQHYGQELLDRSLQFIVQPNGNEQTYANILHNLLNILKNVDLRYLLSADHCKVILYDTLLPKIISTNEDIKEFSSNPIEFIRKEEDYNFHTFRTAAMELIEGILFYMQYDNKSELIKFVEHAATALQPTQANDLYKQVIVKVLTHNRNYIVKNPYLRGEFQNLTLQFFLPLVKSNNELLCYQTCLLLAGYLSKVTLSTQVVNELMAVIYSKMTSDSLPIKYAAILAFTALLTHEDALIAAKPHFQTILEIYVKILECMEHEQLLSSLESIVKNFSSEIVSVAGELINHLVTMFYSYCKQENDKTDDDDDNNNEATAALSIIKQILQSPLSAQGYLSASEHILPILEKMVNDLSAYFDQILSLFNVLVYKAPQIVNYEFPYLLCRKLQEGNNSILGNSTLPQQYLDLIGKAEKADYEYEEVLLSILKNLIQKCPDEVLHRFPYPRNSELILCLIENKRVTAESLPSLDTCEVSPDFSKILQSYSYVVYSIGQMSDSRNLKVMAGISLYPWLSNNFNADTVKLALFFIADQDEDDEDDLDEENTMQLLERYANDDDDDEEDFNLMSGTNYSYLYDSPYNCSNDRSLLINQLKSLSQQDTNYLLNSLSTRNKKRIESLFA